MQNKYITYLFKIIHKNINYFVRNMTFSFQGGSAFGPSIPTTPLIITIKDIKLELINSVHSLFTGCACGLDLKITSMTYSTNGTKKGDIVFIIKTLNNENPSSDTKIQDIFMKVFLKELCNKKEIIISRV